MRATCEKWGDRPFIGEFSYRDVLRMSDSVVVRPSRMYERVVVSSSNTAGMIARIMALWREQSIPVLVPVNMRTETKEYCINMMMQHPQGHPNDAMILFTSSTSGSHPKGVRLGHHGLLAHIEMLRQHVPDSLFSKDDRTLAFLPWTHCYGLMGECLSVMDRGACMNVLPSASFNPYRFLWGLHRTAPTILFVVPRILSMLMPYPKWVWGGTHLRYIVSGGAYLDPVLKRRFIDCHRIPVLQGYGMTEMSPMVSLQNSPDAFLGDDVGSLLPNIRVQIDPHTNEILVDSPAKFNGYLNDPLQDNDNNHGMYRTGDIGSLDRDDILTVKGRVGDMVKTPNGRFISLGEIECNIQREYPWVREICLWQENGLLRGIIYGHPPASGSITSRLRVQSDTGFNIDATVVTQPFANLELGTLTLKGEISRQAVRLQAIQEN